MSNSKRYTLWLVLLAAAGTFALTMGTRQTMSLFLSPLNTATGLGLASISLAFAFGQLWWGLTQPFAGAMADKIGAGRVLFIGTLLIAVGTFITPYMTSTWGLILAIGVLSAGIILAIMIIPFIASVMRDVFDVTPPMLKESAYALGSTTWEVMFKVVLPYTKSGVIGGIMLGLGRALGETMAVTFVIGNFNQLDSLSLFAPANSITSALANEFAEATTGLHQAALIYLGLVLFFITFVVLSLSKLLLARLQKSEGRAA
jgi:ABC-type phosphate transport system permease subunit